MGIIISNVNMPSGCQRCKFFRKHLFGNGLDYSYSCILGAKDFPMPWIRQMEERASDCPIEPLEQEPIFDKIRAEIKEWYWQVDKQALAKDPCVVDAMVNLFIRTIDKYKVESEDK